MGLPLFVAKVESDLPNKATGKHDVLAPTNAGVRSIRSRIRRIVPPSDDPLNERESRWRLERSRTWRENGRALRRGQRIADSVLGDGIPMVSAPSPPAPPGPPVQPAIQAYVDFHNQTDPVDQAMDEYLRLNSEQRQRWAHQLQDLLGPRWNEDALAARNVIHNLRIERARRLGTGENFRRAVEGVTGSGLGSWTAEPRPQARRARVVSPVFPMSDELLSPAEMVSLRALTSAMQRERRAHRSSTIPVESNERAGPPRLDGLGDRQRSMSPEMWDTLLSTMTPDPEPPSVSSSFASFPTNQSHITNASSFSVPDSGARPAGAFVPEPPCDSGAEDSDPEDTRPAQNREAQRQRRLSRRSRHLPARSSGPDGFIDEPSDETLPSTSGNSLGRPRGHYLRVGWVGELSVGANDEAEAQPDRPTRETRESGTPAPHSHNEDDWSGMQLIVRGLARREDIPDEWWLEAGLSRTLGDDANMQ